MRKPLLIRPEYRTGALFLKLWFGRCIWYLRQQFFEGDYGSEGLIENVEKNWIYFWLFSHRDLDTVVFAALSCELQREQKYWCTVITSTILGLPYGESQSEIERLQPFLFQVLLRLARDVEDTVRAILGVREQRNGMNCVSTK